MKTEKRFLSRMLAMLLVFAMLAGLSVRVRAREQSTSRQIQALPYQGEHPLAPGISDAFLESQPQYEPEDPVDIIVELKEKPLLSSYVKSKFADLQSYKTSHSGSALEARLLAQQQTVLAHMEQELDSQAEVLYYYTTVMNGFSVRAKYGDLELIRSLPGVQNAFVAAESRLVEPTMESAAEMSNAIAAWNAQYKGTGTTIAIIDTGLDVDHEAFVTDPTGAVYDKTGIANTMHLLSFVAEAAHGSLTAEDVYVSLKVPFAFDYADNDCDVTPDQAWNMNTASHGTHVAGIAAGYAETPEGEVTFCGVAPDAQLLIMKVFSDYGNGAYDSTTLAALEDAVSLGADVINMSLGSASGFTVSRDETVAAVYERVREAGITLMCAAGNDYDSALGNNSGYHMSLTANIDTGVVSAPATYAGAVAVASAENVVAQLPALSAGDRMITYTGIDVDIKSIAGTYEYVMIDGIGTVEDYAAAGDLSGKIAVVQRGELTFTEKVLNGQAAKAAAVIIYNNIDENLNYMTVEGSSIPAVYISLEDGRYLKSLSDKRLTVHAQDQFMPNPTAGQISQFSSLGVTAELTLKPEITAPGGYIYSALPESMGNYGSMSGTSMASPFMAGAAALVRQYLKDRYPSLSAQRIQEMTIQLLMSTAQPLMNAESGCFYSPRMQGNGLVDVGAALETPAYIRTGPEANSENRPVVNLGDDVERSGVYNLAFQVINTSSQDVTYDMEVVTLAPQVFHDGDAAYLDTTSVMLDASGKKVQTITVPAGQTVEVSCGITLSQADKDYLDANFENGSYVEGFVRLVSQTGVPLTLSFLGFYGDWTAAPILDSAAWYETDKQASNLRHQAVSYVPYYRSFAVLGENAYCPEPQTYDPQHFYISPNADGYFDNVQLLVSLLRNAETVTYTVTDEAGTVHYEAVSHKNFKTIFDQTTEEMVPASVYEGYAPEPYGGTDAFGNVLPDGTRLTYTVTATFAYPNHPSNTQNTTFSFPLGIDTVAPKLEGMSVRVVQENERRYLEGIFTDANAVMDIAVMGVQTYGSSHYPDVRTRRDVYGDGSPRQEFRVDITDITSETLYLSGWDYAYNVSEYYIPLVDADGLALTEESLLLHVGQQAQLSAINNTDSEDTAVIWSTDDGATVSVTEYGMVTAHKPGVAMISATTANGETATCMVGVRDRGTVEKLSLNVQQITVPLGSAAQLTIQEILPEGIFRSDDEVEWTTDNSQVVGLYGSYFYADAVGTATITATLDGVSDSCVVTVVPVDGDRELFLRNEYPVEWGGEYVTMQKDYVSPADHWHFFYGRFRSQGTELDVVEDLIWTTSDSSIVNIAVDPDGTGQLREDGSILADHIMAQYVGAGMATITATTRDGSQSRSFTVYLLPNDQPMYIYFDPTVVTMELGQTLEAGCSIEPVSVEEQFNKIYWKSLDPRVATVEDGVITARYPGYTMITGTLTSGYDNCLMVYVEGIVKSQLQALVDQAKAIDLSACRDGQSKDAFLAALARAEAVLADDTADQTQIDAAQDALLAAIDALESRLPFTDVPDDAWYYEGLRYVWQKGLMLGIEQNVFDPESPITRGQLITVLHRLAGSPQAKAPDPFSDIPENRYYTAAVAWAYENNITTGVTETLFAPEASVTREQMVTFFARYAEMEGHTVETDGNLDAFIDGGSVSTYAVTAMTWAVSAGLINGVDESTLAPQGNATRAQMAAILMRYCEAMN